MHGEGMSAVEDALITGYLKKHVIALADDIGQRHVNTPHALHKAANYISREWETMGYQVEPQSFGAMGIKCLNLQVERKGSDEDAGIIVVASNYDTVKNCPGANDNASGMAALLEISRIFCQLEPKQTVRFVALSNERAPFLGTERMGSWIYAHHAQQDFADIKQVIILDSLGYYNPAPDSQLHPPMLGMFYGKRATFLAMVSDLLNAPAMFRFNRFFNKASNFPTRKVLAPGILKHDKWTDHSAFGVHGFRSFVITDTSYHRYPFHNSERDHAERLDFQSLSNITAGLAKALGRFSKAQF